MFSIKKYQDKNWLTEQYWGFNLTIKEIAKISNCERQTIERWMGKYHISTDRYRDGVLFKKIKNKKIPYRNKEWLLKQIYRNNLTNSEISKKINSDSDVIHGWLKYYNIPINFSMRRNDKGEKCCTKCRKWKQINDFLKLKKSKDGLDYICRECHSKDIKKSYKRRYLKTGRENAKEGWWVLKQQVIFYYSNGKMECQLDDCPIKNSYFDLDDLSIDHINGGGNKHKKAISCLYSWLICNNFPDGFRVLCLCCQHREYLKSKKL